MYRINVNDVMQASQQANVSYEDVLRVLYSDHIDPAIQNRVLRVWRLLQPATRFHKSQSKSLGIIVPGAYTMNDYVGQMLSSAQERAEALGYETVVHCQHGTITFEAHESLTAYFEALFATGHADQGFLIVTLDNYELLTSVFQTFRCPYLLTDCEPNDVLARQHSSVGVDNRLSMKNVVKYLIGLGHQRIGFITGRIEIPAAHWRLQGYKDALAEANIPLDEHLIRHGDWLTPSGQAQALELLSLDSPPTAIAASNDLMAIGALSAAVQTGRRVPADLSLTGFDDIETASTISPKLTTMRQPLPEMARGAVDMLDKMIDKGSTYKLNRGFATELIIRESTGPASHP